MRTKVVDLRLGDDVAQICSDSSPAQESCCGSAYFICTYVKSFTVSMCVCSCVCCVCKLYLPFTFYSTKYFLLFAVDLNNLLAVSVCVGVEIYRCVCVFFAFVICTKHFWHIICFIWRIVCLFCWFAAPSSLPSATSSSSSSSNHFTNKQFSLNLCKFISLTFGLLQNKSQSKFFSGRIC